MKKKIVITGSSGTIASFLVKNSLKKLDICKLDYRKCRNINLISKALKDFNADVLIHCAAPTDLDNAEIEKDKHYEDNFVITRNLVDYIKNKNVIFIYMSSTGVYGDWKDSYYKEDDQCIPSSFHHKCKLEAENYIIKNLNSYFILRLGWVFSSNFSKDNNDFVAKMHKILKMNNDLTVNMIQKGVPTSTSLIDKVVSFIIENPKLKSEIYNVVSSGQASRMEYILKIQEVFKTASKIKGTKNFSRLAKVSNNETASNKKLSLLIDQEIPDWEHYINNIKK
tara:strand:- start:11515 stop:12357 length:843 start_codon:yes stop_codon:yes gene_type:complete